VLVHAITVNGCVLVHAGPVEGGVSHGFLAAVSKHMSLPLAVATAAATSVLTLDSAQRDYLSAVLGGPLPEPPQQAAAGIGSGATVQELQAAKDALSLVKDVLPDFGDGFLTAVLLVRSFPV
jgi:hypothetical protein